MRLLMITSLILALTTIESPFASAQGNSGDRGGGDEYSAEIFHIARGVTKKLRQWTKDGILKLTEAQIEAVESIVDMNETAASSAERSLLLEVDRKDHAYKHPEFLPDLDRAEEKTLINIFWPSVPGVAPHAPRIEVGKINWDALHGKADEKEMLVLHELLGAAKILKDGQRLDDQFKISYETKLASLKEWSDFKENLKISFISIWLTLGKTIDPNYKPLKTLANFLENDPGYVDVIYAGNKFLDLKKVESFRKTAFDRLNKTYQKNLKDMVKDIQADSADRAFVARKSVDLILTKISSENPLWTQWAKSMIQDFISIHERAQRNADRLSSEGAIPQYIERICSKDVNLDQKLLCYIEVLSGDDFRLFIMPELKIFNKGLNQAFNLTLDEIEMTVTPSEIDKRFKQ